MEVLLDLTEFCEHPLRTGIQRVCAALCAHWPAEVPLLPVRVTRQGRLVPLGASARHWPRRVFTSPTPYAAQRMLLRAASAYSTWRGPGITRLEPRQRLLVPEVFTQDWRVDFYGRWLRTEQARTGFLVHDVLPLTHPHLFPGTNAPYHGLLRGVRHTAFTSSATRAAFAQHVLGGGWARGPDGWGQAMPGPVLTPGADGLIRTKPSLARADGPPSRPQPPAFAVIASLEPRKQHALILDAFDGLWPAHPRLELHLVGRLAWADAALRERLERTARERAGFRWHGALPDARIATLVSRCRATLFLSPAEGFGLPPLESLALGVPAIVGGSIPSLEGLGEAGLVRLPRLDAPTLARAVESLLDDATLARKTAETAGLRLPTWRDFAQRMAAWAAGWG